MSRYVSRLLKRPWAYLKYIVSHRVLRILSTVMRDPELSCCDDKSRVIRIAPNVETLGDHISMALSFGSYAVENPLAKIRGRSGVGLWSIDLVPLAGLVTLGRQTLTREGHDSSWSPEHQLAEIY